MLNYNFDLDIMRYVAFNFDTIDGIELDVHDNELKMRWLVSEQKF